MQFTISKAELVRLMASTTKVVEARNTIPILSTVRLVADDGRLAVTATDLDIEISASAACEIEADSSACVDAKLLSGIVNKLSGDTVAVLTNGTLSLKSGRSSFKLQTLPASDFPDMTHGTFAAEFDVDMAALVAPCQFAMSNEDARFYLCGVFLHTVNGTLRAVATDGHRLSRNVLDMDVAMPDIIIPRKAVGLLPKGTVNVAVSDTKMRITKDDIVFVTKLIDGTYPDYQRIIPTGNDKAIVADNATLRASVERVSTISSERGRAVKMAFAEGNATLSVRHDNEALDVLPVTYDGGPIEIGFNAAYLIESLANLPAGDVTIALADSGAPALLTAASAPGLLSVLMPTRM